MEVPVVNEHQMEVPVSDPVARESSSRYHPVHVDHAAIEARMAHEAEAMRARTLPRLSTEVRLVSLLHDGGVHGNTEGGTTMVPGEPAETLHCEVFGEGPWLRAADVAPKVSPGATGPGMSLVLFSLGVLGAIVAWWAGFGGGGGSQDQAVVELASAEGARVVFGSAFMFLTLVMSLFLGMAWLVTAILTL